MILKPLTTITGFVGPDTAKMDGYLFGGCLITTDGTNAAVVTVREDVSDGKILFYISTKTPGFFTAPIMSKSKVLYLSVTGTGASAFFYESIL